MKNQKSSVARQIKELAKWLENPVNHDLLVQKPTAEIVGYLEELKPALYLSLESIATWEATSGELHLLQGNRDGWVQIQRSYLYYVWSRRIYLAYLDKGRFKSMNVGDVALLLMHAIAIRDDSFADFIGQRLMKSFQNNDKKFKNWDLAPFEPFALQVYAIWRRKSLDSSITKCAVSDIYSNLLKNWEDDKEFGKSLSQACDYHLQRTDDSNDEGFPEFMSRPYDWFPVEILAIARIREDQGRSTPSITHPLMQTELAKLPGSILTPQDELLRKVIVKARTDLAIGDPW